MSQILNKIDQKLLKLCLYRIPKNPKTSTYIKQSDLRKVIEGEIFRSSRLKVTIVLNSTKYFPFISMVIKKRIGLNRS